MSIVPVLNPKEIIKALQKVGFKIVRQVGSHVRLRHTLDSTRQTSVPMHNGDIPRWLLKEILKQSKISINQLLNILKEK